MITSRQNQHIKHLMRLLTSAEIRKQKGEYVIEGVHLLQSVDVQDVLSLFVTDSRINHPEVKAIAKQIPAGRIFYLSEQLIQQVSMLNDSKDVIAIVKMPTLLATSHIKEDCVLLDRIQDPGNVGTIIRTAAASGVRHILLNAACADVYMPKVLRATMGAHVKINLYPETDLFDFVKRYTHNVFITELNQSSSSLYELDLTAPNAWMFGNEGTGVTSDFSTLVQKKVKSVHIPMIGATESLNVAMAASICLFEQLRQRMYGNKNTRTNQI